jgi:calcium binding protein 39
MSAALTETFRSIKKALVVFEPNTKKGKETKGVEKITTCITFLKTTLSGDIHPDTELSISNHMNEFLFPLISNLHKFDFEGKKDICHVICRIARIHANNKSPTVEYIVANPNIIDCLFAGYENPSSALSCGTIIRGLIEREEVARIVLNGDNFFKLYAFIENQSFDVATDSFNTLKDLLGKHKAITAEFLERNYDQVFTKYTNMLNSPNYVTKRQSLKLLGELLLDKVNFNVMTKYISFSKNLKLMMSLLIDDSRSIQFEAFHVFKIFVANPHKPEPILKILRRNKQLLHDFLTTFHNDNDDEQFTDEKSYLLKQIQLL